ncbi:MAG: hypothetical protein EBZ69_08675 [Alphaproteobacteria bacterium]|nr:hypothetical protein [Alphaproteobacteria bacterium]NDC56860.1 hypothetical protein [Alphaproteobacteria bacterium]NDG04580.1 hypothetical protein [Alphaproteobacteria bacterium]
MHKVKTSLQELYKELENLSDTLDYRHTEQHRELAKQAEALKVSRAREANNLALAQKVANRLDHAILRVETLLRGGHA